MEEYEGIGYGEGIIGRGFAFIVRDLVCITLMDDCEVCEKVVNRDGFFVIAEETVCSGWR